LNVHGGLDRCLRILKEELGGDVMIFTETWLTGPEAEERHKMRGFRHFFSCRNSKSEHGGVSVYVREGIRCDELESCKQPEILALSLGNLDLLIVAVYASPRQANKDNAVFENISTLLSRLQTHRCTIIIGDFNARIGDLRRTVGPFDPHDPIGLREGDDLEGNIRVRVSQDEVVNVRGRECISFCNDFYMDVLNGCAPGDEGGSPTYYSMSREGSSVIDLAIISAACFEWVKEFVVIDTRNTSDHSIVSLLLDFPSLLENTKRDRGSQRRVPWDQSKWSRYAEKVKGSWESLAAATTELAQGGVKEIGQVAEQICNSLISCAKAAFKGTWKTKSVDVGWWDDECLQMKRRVKQGWTRCSGQGIRSDAELRRDTLLLKAMIRRKQMESKVRGDLELARYIRENPGLFWNKVKKPRPAGGAALDIEAAVTHFTELLNVDHIGEGGDAVVRQEQRGGRTVVDDDVPLAGFISMNDDITEAEVIKVFLRLSNNKSTSDGLRSEMFKYAKIRSDTRGQWQFLMAGVIAKLFQSLFSRGLSIPEGWKSAYIVPIWKGKGDKGLLTNYRGVSLTTTLYKIYAMVLEARLSKACDTLNLRAPTQCGFRRGLGTTSAIFALNHVIQSACSPRSQGGKNVPLYVIFVDFKKAFDSVCRSLLWKRLESLGIKGRILKALQGIYDNTKFQIKLGGKISKGCVVTVTGVKQGCPLSPTLFGLFIEELHEFLKSECPSISVCILEEIELKELLYADDVQMMALSLK